MTDLEKFWESIKVLKLDVQCTVNGDVLDEDDFNNNIHWNTGIDENGLAITTVEEVEAVEFPTKP
mgnify:CR=1 FL=1